MKPALRRSAAFTLLEVMIALAIFFIAVFSILGSVSRSLGAARSLQQNFPDLNMLTMELMMTNRLEEGIEEGDFGELHPDYTWTRETYSIATNGLFQIDYTIRWTAGRRAMQSQSSLLLWRPESVESTVGRRR